MARLLNKSWVQGYLDVIDGYTESPEVWSWWSAVTAICGTMKKHCWVDRGSWKLYPNDFTVLVGRPGLGKGAAIGPIVDIINRANSANILSDRLTIEWILDRLSQGFPSQRVSPNGGQKFGFDATCLIVAPELSVFLRYPEDELPDLADLWDATDRKKLYGTRGKGLKEIDAPGPSMLAGCAPEWLTHAIPPNAIGGGFTRRVNFVYAKDKAKVMPWPLNQDFKKLTEPLVEDLKDIAQLSGEFTFDSDAKPLFEHLYSQGDPTQWDDEATANYTISRWAHVTKVAMALSAARGTSRVISKLDIEEAVDRVVDVTDGLRVVFRSVGESDMVTVADKVVRYLEARGSATFKQIIGVMWKDCTKAELEVILATLMDAGILVEGRVGSTSVLQLVQQTTPKKQQRVKVGMP